MKTEDIIRELLEKQRTDIGDDIKLTKKELLILAKNINDSIFSKDCIRFDKMQTYKKCGKRWYWHRLLYVNFINNLEQYEYLKHIAGSKKTCQTCVNPSHYFKMVNKSGKIIKKYKDPQEQKEIEEWVNKELKLDRTLEEKLTIDFDW